MKKGTTAIQNIDNYTAALFRDKKRKLSAEHSRDYTNDEFLLELLQ